MGARPDAVAGLAAVAVGVRDAVDDFVVGDGLLFGEAGGRLRAGDDGLRRAGGRRIVLGARGEHAASAQHESANA